ncbi:MAG TPA: single-stranded-DNA-specific exonuclease RecJ [Candidatus Hydrogenedentes bacterium]|nr:single-stranded-DNA-specific exonuclease RecJ [Candidatus Hydrogenedentota bacterium]HRT19278.1 single-stranded-DNA-specific exonuclease RecJ [Candidatus Hydrogenedentota bacterium]HRT63358.1 single-stranded-DNA-specific exonuclease RecJ [Candidatus Hydrogenedentota bacterium]
MAAIHDIVAIDGPAGAGKSTVARRTAAALGYAFLDTGAMYRAATWRALHHGVDLDDPSATAASTRAMRLEMPVVEGIQRIWVDGCDVTEAIRTPDITRMVCKLDQNADVRAPLVALQRAFGAKQPTVAEGRDMGTVVFPDARCKIYLDASIEARTRRRAAELRQKGLPVNEAELREEIRIRDEQAMTRAVSPLRRADDAVYLDTTNLTIDEVVEKIVALVKSRTNRSAHAPDSGALCADSKSPISARPWKVLEADTKTVSSLCRALGVPRIVAHLLASRGIGDPDAARAFLSPSMDRLSDPLSLTDMDRAVDRLRQARARGERVLLFGDYDVDGIAGTALLYLALKRFGLANCSYALPSRLIEGYGIAPEHVEAARADGVRLIVTVDNGINARDAAEAARLAGIDLIVTDHHQPEGEPPHACAVVNPKREDPGHPMSGACGAAVAFHLARALTGEDHEIDLAALGTIADIMPLVGENRILAAVGLKRMGRKPRAGLAQLAAVSKVSLNEIVAEKITFQLAPRINAAGRLGTGDLPLRLLLTDDPREALTIARDLDAANNERKRIEQCVFEEAAAAIEAEGVPGHGIALARRGWHQGVIGVVAARLLSAYHRPIALIAIDEDGIGRASARSIPGLDLMKALEGCKDHIVRFGGHAAAAGFTIKEASFPAFREAFAAQTPVATDENGGVPALGIDSIVSFSELTPRIIAELNRLEPFGHGNPAPLFCTYGVRPLPNSYAVMRNGHARIMLQQGPAMLRAVGFGMAESLRAYANAPLLDVAFVAGFNTFRDETTVQLTLKDVRVAGDSGIPSGEVRA